ncbi:hypothetical protein C8R45DRAFT_1084258 [Mycena sanguinolenta]|nr:hypothetical protein C8R45DRAFT_1084258 [Mycena sanguinolenta]
MDEIELEIYSSGRKHGKSDWSLKTVIFVAVLTSARRAELRNISLRWWKDFRFATLLSNSWRPSSLSALSPNLLTLSNGLRTAWAPRCVAQICAGSLDILLDWGLMGVLATQLYFYHEAFQDDRLPIKLLVYGLVLLDVLQTAMTKDSLFLGSSFSLLGFAHAIRRRHCNRHKLVDRVKRAIEHDEEARQIQQRGMLFAREVSY